MYFLAETGKPEAVEIIFDLICNLDDEEYAENKDSIERALFSKDLHLHDKQFSMIIDNLEALITSRNPREKTRGRELHERKQLFRIYP